MATSNNSALFDQTAHLTNETCVGIGTPCGNGVHCCSGAGPVEVCGGTDRLRCCYTGPTGFAISNPANDCCSGKVGPDRQCLPWPPEPDPDPTPKPRCKTKRQACGTRECGRAGNGCGGTFKCGSCRRNQKCRRNRCVNRRRRKGGGGGRNGGRNGGGGGLNVCTGKGTNCENHSGPGALLIGAVMAAIRFRSRFTGAGNESDADMALDEIVSNS